MSNFEPAMSPRKFWAVCAIVLFSVDVRYLLALDGIPFWFLFTANCVVFIVVRSRLAVGIRVPTLGHLAFGIPESVSTITFLAVLSAVVLISSVGNGYLLHFATLVMWQVALALGLWVVVRTTGLLDVGYAIYPAVGAYASALAARSLGFGLLPCLMLATSLGIVIGMIIGSLLTRLRGHYYSVASLGAGLAAYYTELALVSVTGGPSGVYPVPGVSAPMGLVRNDPTGSMSPDIAPLLLCVLLASLAVVLSGRLRRSTLGRLLLMARRSEFASATLGVSGGELRMIVYTAGAGLGAGIGAVFAPLVGYVNPDSFGVVLSVSLLAMVLAGMPFKSFGVVTASVLLSLLPEKLHALGGGRMFVFGSLIFLLLLLRELRLSRSPGDANVRTGVSTEA